LKFGILVIKKKYSQFAPSYYSVASIIILVYDITDKKSFEAIQYNYKNLNLNATVITALVGNKIDLDNGVREVSTEEGTEFAKKNNLSLFFETSAKTGQNIDLIFANLAERAIERK